MASTIRAGLTTGTAIAISGDTSGALVLQTNGTTTAVTISTAQVVTLAQPLPVASGGTGSTSTTFVNLTTNVTGTLPVANGGTGVTTSTGTGANVLGTSPTISGAVLSTMASSVLTSGTAVASTSGTSIDFTSIPSWVKRITVMFNGVSTNGTSNPLFQIGSGSVATTGYLSSNALANSGTTAVGTNTNGFGTQFGSAANALYGTLVIYSFGSNIYVASYSLSASNSGSGQLGSGGITLGGTLDRVRITTVNGTDTFDAGSINILYE